MQQSCPVFFDIGDQAETCAQLFYVKESFYGFEKNIDLLFNRKSFSRSCNVVAPFIEAVPPF